MDINPLLFVSHMLIASAAPQALNTAHTTPEKKGTYAETTARHKADHQRDCGKVKHKKNAFQRSKINQPRKFQAQFIKSKVQSKHVRKQS
jgi:hypothetical protein